MDMVGNRLINNAFYQLQLSFSVSSIIDENDTPCEEEADYPANSAMTNFHAKVTNSIAKMMNSTSNRMDLITKVMNSVAKVAN